MGVRERTVYQFCVVCPGAEQVCLMGDFNGWSTTATPMRNTEEHVWQLSIELPHPDGAAAAAVPRFSYFVIDQRRGTGRAPFGGTYLLPGTWAAIVEAPAVEGDRTRNAVATMPPPLSN